MPESAKPNSPCADLPPELANHPKYRILRELGRGGMGVVYQAQQIGMMERHVVIKVINRSLIDNPEVLARFRREVKAASQLSHPNIVTAHDAEMIGDLHLLVMEFVPGHNLADVLAAKGPLPISSACNYVRQAARALQHAHERGMVHRDIKPENLMLTPEGQIKVLDFGIAKVVSEQNAGTGLTASNSYVGTPEYSAPEQATDAHSADIRADLYSLGCTLYCLLTGRPPFQETTAMKTLLAHLQKEPSPLPEIRPDVPEGLCRLVARLLAKEPKQRYQTPSEVVQALAPFVKGTLKALPLQPAPPQEEQPVALPTVNHHTTIEGRRGIVAGELAASDGWGREAGSAASKRWLMRSIAGGIAALVLLSTVILGLWASGVFRAKVRQAPTPATERSGNVPATAPSRSPALITDSALIAESAELNRLTTYGSTTDIRKWLTARASTRLLMWRDAAAHGSVEGMFLFAWCLSKGIGLAKNEKEAVTWFRKAAEQGHVPAQNRLGFMYENGRGVAQDYIEAVRWYRKAAEQSHPAAGYYLGLIYANGRGVARNDIEAVKWYRKAAEQGYPWAQYNLGFMYSNGRGVVRNYTEALQWYRKAALQGHEPAQNNLGDMYYYGRGVPQDSAEAVKWYRKAAEQGYARGQDNLGFMYSNGRGVVRNYTEALQWYRKAAEQDYAAAQCNLGDMYDEGRSVPQDSAEAVRWYRKAAEQSYARGQNNLGFMYSNGRGVVRNYTEALQWYRKAAEQDYAAAQCNLGDMYEKGHGVARNDTEAVKWYRMAAAQGNELAIKALKRLGVKKSEKGVESRKKGSVGKRGRDLFSQFDRASLDPFSP